MVALAAPLGRLASRAARVCRELLPARVSYCRGAAADWCPCRRVLGLTTSRKGTDEYDVAELPVCDEWGGRAFQLGKRTPGTDADAGGYACLVSHRGGPAADSCECRGFLRHGHCKHLDGLRAVLGNGWMDLQPLADAPAGEAPF